MKAVPPASLASRAVALLLLAAFGFTSCVNPVDSEPVETRPAGTGEPEIIPGQGTPNYAFLDAEGNIIETETTATGYTGFWIDGNNNAEGVVIISDDTNHIENRVVITDPSAGFEVSMFFRKGANFPYRMVMTLPGEGDITAWFSQYNYASSSYDIIFQQNGAPDETILDIALNPQIFSVYSESGYPQFNASQHTRMRNIFIALGTWVSISEKMQQLE